MKGSWTFPGVFTLLVCLLATDNLAQEADPERAEQHARWVEELGSADYSTREAAYQNLWQAGREVLELVESATHSDDPEREDRARRLLTLVRWNITPDLFEKVGPRLLEFESMWTDEKNQVLDEVRGKAGPLGLPFFRAVLEGESDADVWGRALEHARHFLGNGMTGWLEEIADRGDAADPIYRHLADLYAEIPVENLPRERIVGYADQILGREDGFSDPAVYSGWTTLLLSLDEAERADRLLAVARERVGDDPDFRATVMRALLAAEQLSRGLSVVEGDLSNPDRVPEIVGILLSHRYLEDGRRLALSALERFEGDPLRMALHEVFVEHLEFESALKVVRTLEGFDQEELLTLYRYTLDAGEGIGLARRAFEAARAEAPDSRDRWGLAFIAYLQQCLHHGRAAEALEACRRHPEVFENNENPLELQLALRAAVGAFDYEAASVYDERLIALAGPVARLSDSTEFNRARLALYLERGQRDRLIAIAPSFARDIGPKLRIHAATGEARVLAGAAPVANSQFLAFDAIFGQGLVAERAGRPGEALFEYARGLAEIGSTTNTRLVWHWTEVARKAAYLGRVEGARADALARADRLGDPHLRHRTRAEISRQTGDWNSCAIEFEALLALEGNAPAPADRLDLAWAQIEAGRLDRADTVLAWFSGGGGGPSLRRVALLLIRRAARLAGRAEEVDRIDRLLYAGRIDKESVYHSAFFVTSRGLAQEARSEWEAILDAHQPGNNFPFYLSNAWEYLSHVYDQLGVETQARADYFLRGLQACWINGYTIIERGGESRYRAMIDHWLALDARATGDEAREIELLEQAVAHDPFFVPSALRLAELLRGSDPELSAAVERSALDELRRSTLAEPTNPDAHLALARALGAAGKVGAALRLARRAVELGGEDDARGFIQELEARAGTEEEDGEKKER